MLYLSKRSGFVWKDVLDLSQLFIESGGSCSGRGVGLTVIHFDVPASF